MKKVLLLCFLVFSFLNYGVSQNLVQNGNFESWDDTNTPTGWSKVENTSQESTIKHGDLFSAKHVGGTKDLGQVIAVTPGQTYKLKMWYYVAAGDNSDARIWSYWRNTGTDLNDNANELRGPNDSYFDADPSNPSWQKYEVVVTAPATANEFYLEVRTYKNATVYWDDFSFEAYTATGTVELTYPNGGEIFNSGDNVTLTWNSSNVDNVKFDVLTEDGWVSFVDGPIAAADNSLEVAIPVNASDWNGYKIRVVDYSVGSISDESDAVFTINGHDTKLFGEGFAGSVLGSCSAVSVLGDQAWTTAEGDAYAKMSGYSGGHNLNEDWLITSAINLDNSTDEILEFKTACNYSGPDLLVKYSTDYDGQGNPAVATWTEFSSYNLSKGSWAWTNSGLVELNSISGDLYVAFIYSSTGTEGKTWQVSDISISGMASSPTIVSDLKKNDVLVSPNPFQNNIKVEADSKVVSVAFYNSVGQLVKEVDTVDSSISTAKLAKGLYIIQLTFEDGSVATQKVTKK